MPETPDQIRRRILSRIPQSPAAQLRSRLGLPPASIRRGISPERIEEIAAEQSPGVLQTIGDVLSFPGDIARGTAVQLKDLFTPGDIPFQRTTAREFLSELGLEPSAEFNIRDPFDPAGLAAGTFVLASDILTDPLALVTGVGTLTKGEKLLRGATSAAKRGREIGKLGARLEAPASTFARRGVERVNIPPRISRADVRARPGLPRQASARVPGETVPRATIPRTPTPRELLQAELPTELTAALPRSEVAALAREELRRSAQLLGEAAEAGSESAQALLRDVIAQGRGPTRGGIARRLLEQAPRAPVVEQFRRGERALLQFGAGRFKFKVPVPRPLEAQIARAITAVPRFLEEKIGLGTALARPFRKPLAKSKEATQAARLLGGLTTARLAAKQTAFTAVQEEALVKPVADAIIGSPPTPPEAIREVLRQELFTDLTNARQLGTAEVRNKYGEAVSEYVEEVNAMVRQSYESQIARGARNHALIEDYAERILTPAGRQALRAQGKGAAYRDFLTEQANLWDNSQFRRENYMRDALNTDAERFFREQMGMENTERFFNLNPAETVARTVRERSMTVINAELAHSFLNDMIGVPGRAGDMSAINFIKAIKLRNFRGKRLDPNNESSIAGALEAAGISPISTVPGEAAADFIKIYGKFERLGPKPLRKFVEEVWDPMNSIFRIGVTAPLPFFAFHARNFNSNLMLNYMGGVSPKSYGPAVKAFLKTNRAWNERANKLGFRIRFDERLAEQYSGLGLTRGGQLGEISEAAAAQIGRAETAGGPSFLGGAAILSGRGLRFARQNPLSRAGFQLGAGVEDFSRIAHFLDKKRKGFTNSEAIASVNKFLFDYSNEALSGMEKGLLNRLFFFYRWQRFALPLIMERFLTDPRRVAVLAKVTTQPGIKRPVGIPEFVREAAGIPAGPPDPQTGEVPFVSRFGSPLEALGVIDPTGAERALGPLGPAKKVARELIQQMVPFIRVAAELTAGEEFFIGRPIADLDRAPAVQALAGEAISRIPGLEKFGAAIGEEVPRSLRAGGGTRFRTQPDIRFATRALPTSRLTQTASRMLDLLSPFGISPTQIGEKTGLFEREAPRASEKTFPEELLRTFAGVSLADVNVPQERIRQAQRELTFPLERERLRGNVSRLPIFVPTQKGRTDRDVLRQLDIFRRVGQARPQLPPQPPIRSRLGSTPSR
jgi:hypothetical protein